ncbi:hypothetical protein SE17_08115 [Kouleothrix aurantiaca]|uniref:Histidine kinase/HSP90-like ATPase domain-containing protein n=1 Tax=Kouleothrix aurantiaca TaxID=186479 RepID=A0A0P9DUB2_9CHLR|nr:hypothetical protein SE17_08115 [Kouleothrix aurantiaca]
MPYLSELEHNLWVLVAAANGLDQQEGIGDICRRVHPLALYCYLLVRNLALLLKGNVLPPEIVDANSEISEVLTLLEHQIDPEKLNVQLDLATELPMVAMAAVELKQVLMNLLKNAVESMKGRGTLRITTFSGEDEVQIRLQDTGCGIPQPVS